ncbi:DUF3280 domain-containing protein [Geminicoccaceae bacterium 1502E]|nr:DUF3280 domain-containing protein [Geminicoccaceae bacterium 1502E]
MSVRCPVLAVLLLTASPAEGDTLAVFPFELINTGMEPTRPDEEARLQQLDAQLHEALRGQGHEIAGLAPVAGELAGIGSLRACNGCELDLAARLGAGRAVLGWVQKVSNLILNVNLQVREVPGGRLLGGGSADIRGNTDQSWQRGLRSLLRRDVLRTGE